MFAGLPANGHEAAAIGQDSIGGRSGFRPELVAKAREVGLTGRDPVEAARVDGELEVIAKGVEQPVSVCEVGGIEGVEQLVSVCEVGGIGGFGFYRGSRTPRKDGVSALIDAAAMGQNGGSEPASTRSAYLGREQFPQAES
jgi:hypothetical protein